MDDQNHEHRGAFDQASRHSSADASGRLEDVTASLRQDARNMAEQQKDAGADRLTDLGRAVHGAASGLEKELPEAARFVHSAADSLQQASSKLRERSVEDFVGMFDTFARRQPAAAFAGAVLAGFALTRFLKSSSADRRDNA